jgi:hypothetical protein
MLDPLQERQGSVNTKAVPHVSTCHIEFVKRTLKNFRKASVSPADIVDAAYLSAVLNYPSIDVSGIVTHTDITIVRKYPI